MINLTDNVVLRQQGRALDESVRAALAVAEGAIDERFADAAARRGEREGFKTLFGARNLLRAPLGEPFVRALFDYSLLNSQNAGSAAILDRIRPNVREVRASATALSTIKRGVKLTLVELWRRGTLLLPTTFTPASQFPIHQFSNELIDWLLSVDPDGSVPGLQKTDPRRLYYFGPRLVWTTDWTGPEDVSLEELSSLHRAHLMSRRGEYPYVISGSQFPWALFASAVLKRFPGRTTYSSEDLVRYSAWAASAQVTSGDLSTFVPTVHAKRPPRVHSPSRKQPKRGRDERASEGIRQSVGSATTHDAVLILFRRMLGYRPKSIRWQDGVPSYPGREHVDLQELCRHWVVSFNAFLRHRETVQGYRSNHDAVYALNLLADYLFLYLPWWKELNPGASLALPRSPKAFTRFAFVSRHEEVGLDELPATLLAVIRLRRPSVDSAYATIQQLTRYFRFVATHFADDPRIAGAGFTNPLSDEFDTPRLKRKGKTTKEVIPRNLFGHLLFYSYALEEFGQHLLARTFDGDFDFRAKDLWQSAFLDTAAFGFVPVVRYRGKEMPVRWVPNVFKFFTRTTNNSLGSRKLLVPHLTTLRLLIASLETGLRCQSIQWLDVRTWDSLNAGTSEDDYVFALLVNTDKTKTEPWVTQVVYRVRQLLQREAAFQASFADVDAYEPMAYEGLESAPFARIKPLFRSAASGRPIPDEMYFSIWKKLLVGFDAFYREVSGERHVRLYRIVGSRSPDGEVVVRQTRNGSTHCVLTLTTAFTPHSCRASFATNRQGLLELSDVAELIGHEDEVTTAHYTKPTRAETAKRLRKSDLAIVGDYQQFDASTAGVHLRADRSDSALVRSFTEDREGTVERFGFMPAMALWSTADESLSELDGIALLKSGPMSRIRFRETHVCPVGEECPEDVVKLTGAHRRCGLCPLAMKCVDHLPAISAKRHQLLERIRFLQAKRQHMERRGEPAASLDAVWDEMQLDVNELLGWRFSEEVLSANQAKAAAKNEASTGLQVERPDIVRRHLERVTRRSSHAEFLLQRLAESDAYPSMTSERVQMLASSLRRRLMSGRVPDVFADAESSPDDVHTVARMLGVMMKAEGLSISDLAAQLAAPLPNVDAPVLVFEAETSDGA